MNKEIVKTWVLLDENDICVINHHCNFKIYIFNETDNKRYY